MPKARRFMPTRRRILELALAAGVVSITSFAPLSYDMAPDGSYAAFLPHIRALQNMLRRHVREWFDAGQMARADGFVYAVDLNQLLCAFVDANDRPAYDAVRTYALQNLLVNRPSDPLTHGFVVWRCRADEPVENNATGTTEALRLARALWNGAHAFNEPQDAELAVLILNGYARHAAVDQGIWLIRNYFGFGTRSFASNSFLVDYDPDFVQRVADARNDAALRDLAARSYNVVRHAVSPSGLLYDVLQPELKTIIPDLDVSYFSPNDVIQVSNSCSVAMTVTEGARDVARKTMDFMLQRLDDARMYYYGRTSEPVSRKKMDVCAYTMLARLAAQLKDPHAVGAFLKCALPGWDEFCSNPVGPARVWVATEILAGMKAVLDAA